MNNASNATGAPRKRIPIQPRMVHIDHEKEEGFVVPLPPTIKDRAKPVPEFEEPVSATAPSEVVVYSTTDYDMFKHIESNRPIDWAHVRNLAASIKKKNLLHLNPMTVFPDMGIFDGQHRNEAARLCGVPVYYIIDADITDEDISTVNSRSKKWSMENYINHYATKGVQAYIDFAVFCNKHANINPSVLIFLCDKNGRRDSDGVKEGKLDISNLEQAELIISYLADFAKVNAKVATQVNFIKALRDIYNTGQYEHNRMMTKVTNNPTALVPCVDRKGYITVLQSIYNYKVREDNFIQFFKR